MTDTSRRDLLYARLEAVLGPEPAAILMDHLPSQGEPATKTDLRGTEERLDTRMDHFEQRMELLEHRMDRLEQRMELLEQRMEQLEQRLDRLEDHMVRFDERLHDFHGALREQTRNFILSMTGVMAMFAAVIVATGILT